MLADMRRIVKTICMLENEPMSHELRIDYPETIHHVRNRRVDAHPDCCDRICMTAETVVPDIAQAAGIPSRT